VVEQIVAADPDDEVRTAIRRVLRAAEDGTPIERIVVTFAPGAPYGRLLSDHLTAAGLPWNGVAPVPLTERVAGRAVLKAIELDPATLGRHDLFALLQSLPPVRGRPVPGWERLSRRAGVVAGVAEWDQRLERLGRELVDRTGEAGRRPADETPEQAERRAEARARLAEEVEGLRRFVATIVEHLEPPRGASWTAYVRWARRLRDDLLGPATHRSSWPAEELAAADRVDRALDRLARLDAVEGARVDLPTFRSVLEAELADGVTTSGRLGEGLFVGPLPLAIGIDADLVIALGLVEGGLPGSFGDDPLLSDQIRAATGTLTTSQERRDLLRHQLLAVGASAAGVVVASRCRTDLRNGAGRYRSRWWEAVAALGAAGTRHEHGSFHEGLLDQLPPGTEQEALLDDLWRHAASGRPLSAHPLVAADPVLDGALRMVDARAGSAFTEFDGNLRTVAAEGVSFLRDGAMSATALERWANCPFRYFLEVVLDVRDVDNPEDELSIRPIDRGNLVHRVLEQAVGDAIHRHDVPDPGSFWSPDTLEALDRAFGQESADAVARGLVGRPLYWRQARRRLERLLRIFLELDSRERADYGVRPVGAEMAFGREPPFHLELPNGRVLRIAGTIDRVDTSPERVVVIDYKTGSRQSTQREEAAGVRLQLPIYGLAARELLGLPTAAITGEYWHLHHEAKKRGRTTVEVDAERQQQLYTTLATITDGIATGVFVAHPAPPDPWRPWVPCAPCDPDGSGTATVWGQWQRKRRAPELAAYFALVEPEPPDDDGGDRPGGPDLQIADLDWSPA
jgi:RecB family exonuclease